MKRLLVNSILCLSWLVGTGKTLGATPPAAITNGLSAVTIPQGGVPYTFSVSNQVAGAGGTYVGDFNGVVYNLVTLTTNDFNFVSTLNRFPGKSQSWIIVGDTTNHAATFPGTWEWLNGTAPTQVTSNSVCVLSLLSRGTTETEILAIWKDSTEDVTSVAWSGVTGKPTPITMLATNDGSSITNIQGSNIVGAVPLATTAITATNANNVTAVTLTNAVYGTNVSGAVLLASNVSGKLTNDISGTADLATKASYVNDISTNTLPSTNITGVLLATSLGTNTPTGNEILVFNTGSPVWSTSAALSTLSVSTTASGPEPTATNHFATKSYVDSFASLSFTYYLRGTNATTVTNYYAMKRSIYPVAANPITNSVAGVTNAQYVFTYATDPVPNLTLLRSGAYQVTFNMYRSTGGGDAVTLTPEIYVRTAGGVETEIGGGPGQVLGGSLITLIANINISTNITMNATDNVILKFKASAVGGTPTVYTVTEGYYTASLSIPVPSSTFVERAGDTMTGTLTVPSLVSTGTVIATGTNYTRTAAITEDGSNYNRLKTYIDATGTNWVIGADIAGTPGTNAAIIIKPSGNQSFMVKNDAGVTNMSLTSAGALTTASSVSCVGLNAGAQDITTTAHSVLGSTMYLKFGVRTFLSAPSVGGFLVRNYPLNIDRFYINGTPRILTNSTATTCFSVGVYTNQMASGSLFYSLIARQGTTNQVLTGEAKILGIADATGIVTSKITVHDEDSIVAPYTLTLTLATTASTTNGVYVTATPVTSMLAPDELKLTWSYINNAHTNSVITLY